MFVPFNFRVLLAAENRSFVRVVFLLRWGLCPFNRTTRHILSETQGSTDLEQLTTPLEANYS